MASRRRPSRRAAAAGSDRKAKQLCAQVQRTLSLTLAGEVRDEVLQSLLVEQVEPAPDASRMRVVLSVPDASFERGDVLARLEAARPLLRQAVVEAVHRRKAPELAFELVAPSTPRPHGLGQAPAETDDPEDEDWSDDWKREALEDDDRA